MSRKDYKVRDMGERSVSVCFLSLGWIGSRKFVKGRNGKVE